MLKASFTAHDLIPDRPLGTSRGAINQRRIWLLRLHDTNDAGRIGIGEVAPLPGLSREPIDRIPAKIAELCANPDQWEQQLHGDLREWPALRMGVEMALKDLRNGGMRMFHPSTFTLGRSGIPINGLVWMGTPDEMLQRIGDLLEKGFNCIKLKIGAVELAAELDLIQRIRRSGDANTLQVRVDANGAFSPLQAPEILSRLAELEVHSIEQPIAAGLYEAMAELCERSPIPIALDEDLIGLHFKAAKAGLLDSVKPRYIILKPSLIGGMEAAEEWIGLAEERGIGWWVTSALESNLGLNAIAQWTHQLNTSMIHGLGTGSVFTNNFPGPLTVRSGALYHQPEVAWELGQIFP